MRPGAEHGSRRPTPRKTVRAGRNLPVAIAVGSGLVAVILVTVLLSRPAFVVLVSVTVVIGIWELTRAVSSIDAHPPIIPLVVGGVTMQAVAWFAGPEGLVIALFFTVLGCLIWRLADGPVGYFRDVSLAALIALYAPFLVAFGILMVAQDQGAKRLITYLAAATASDIGGYAAGVFFGRHPIAPTVSPKKSWEGFAGGTIAAILAAVIFMAAFFDVPLWTGVALGAAVAVAATIGDLTESMMKRDLGIKDMGSVLPGHGGVMERLDSLSLSGPVAYLLLTLFVAN